MTRLALVVSAPPPDHGPDAAVCVPSVVFGNWEEHAAAVIADWEARWLLIASMPRGHRDEARAELLHAVASALISAAINGVDNTGALMICRSGRPSTEASGAGDAPRMSGLSTILDAAKSEGAASREAPDREATRRSR